MMDAEVRALFAQSLRDAIDAREGENLAEALEHVGWRDALAVDSRAAVSILFEMQGGSNATSSALNVVLGDALGTTSAAIVLPALGAGRPPASRARDRFLVDGLVAVERDELLVVADDEIAAVALAADLELEPVRGLDPALGLLRARGEVSVTDTRPVEWSAAIAGGHRAIAHELIGASRRMLALAREHALHRVQFGRPIATFQAVRHRLAEALVAIETADAALSAAWDDGSVVAAAMAKALAGRGARTTARHCQQVLAGIGFTTEHPLHRYVRRTTVLDQLLGSSKLLTRQLGDELILHQDLPPLLPL